MGKPIDGGDRLTLPRFLRQTALGAVIMAISFLSYLVVLLWRGPSAAWTTQMAWERNWIPFQPGWVFIYLSPYLLGGPLLGLLRPSTFAWYIRRGLLALFVSLAIFILIPTATVRPSLDSLKDGAIAEMYRNVIGIDTPPANAAPSLHVSLSCLLALALLIDFPPWWPVTLLGTSLVWLATLLTWQHHLIDVIAGALLGGLMALPWPWGRRKAIPPVSVKPEACQRLAGG